MKATHAELELSLHAAEMAMCKVTQAMFSANTAASFDPVAHFAIMPLLADASSLAQRLKQLRAAVQLSNQRAERA